VFARSVAGPPVSFAPPSLAAFPFSSSLCRRVGSARRQSTAHCSHTAIFFLSSLPVCHAARIEAPRPGISGRGVGTSMAPGFVSEAHSPPQPTRHTAAIAAEAKPLCPPDLCPVGAVL
jgi:hypothetical protein